MVKHLGEPRRDGIAVRAAREHRGLSLRELARRIEVSPATLSAVETGRTALTTDRLRRIAWELNTAPAELLARGSRRLVATGTGVATADQHGALGDGSGADPGAGFGEASITGREGQVGADMGDWRVFGPLDVDPVIESAITVFVATGYHGATMRQIARGAGVSVPGIYHHYPSKQQLLVTILDRTMVDLRWRVIAARDEGGLASERFTRIVEALALFHATRREVAFIGASEMRSLAEPDRGRIAGLRTEIQRLLDTEAEQAAQDGDFTTMNVATAGRAVSTMCTALAQWFRPDEPASPREIARVYALFAIGMMRVDLQARPGDRAEAG